MTSTSMEPATPATTRQPRAVDALGGVLRERRVGSGAPWAESAKPVCSATNSRPSGRAEEWKEPMPANSRDTSTPTATRVRVDGRRRGRSDAPVSVGDGDVTPPPPRGS